MDIYTKRIAPIFAYTYGVFATVVIGFGSFLGGLLYSVTLRPFIGWALSTYPFSFAPRLWARTIHETAVVKTLDMRRVVRNENAIPPTDPQKPVILIGNHASDLALASLVDACRTLVGRRHFCAIGKMELLRPWQSKRPFINWQFFAIGLPCFINRYAIFVHRGTGEQALASIRRGIRRLPKGFAEIIFCDGTRFEEHKLPTEDVGRYKHTLRFRSGGLYTTVQALPPGEARYILFRVGMNRPQHRLTDLLNLYGARVHVTFRDVTHEIPTSSKEALEAWLNKERDSTEAFCAHHLS